MRVLITGSRGFIGRSVGRWAQNFGHEVLGLGRAALPAPDWTGGYAPSQGTVADLSARLRDFAPDVVLHAAGTASVAASLEDPRRDFEDSVVTLANTLEAVRKSEANPVIVVPSSAAVYGNPKQIPVPEDSPLHPISPYGFHKAACELIAQEYASCFGLRLILCRFFSLFGPLQRRLLVWDLYQRFTDQGAQAFLEGTGTETRDFISVEDAATVLFRLLEAHPPQTGEAMIVNVASGLETSVLELAELMRELLNSDKAITCRGVERRGDPRRWRADISRLNSLLPDWQAQPLRKAVADCVRNWAGADTKHHHAS